MSDLKPCPFCGSDKAELITEISDSYGAEYVIECPNCGATGPRQGAWNNRPREQEAYLAGWRAGREAAASIVEREAFDGLEYCAGQTMALAVRIRILPEPKHEDVP